MAERKVRQLYFSPTGTTRAVVETIADTLGNTGETLDLLRQPLKGEAEDEVLFAADDLLVAGMPVYAGRIPALCRPMLSRLKGNGTPAVAVAVYGNRDYDDALLELKNLLEENGFVVIGAGAFVAQHSIFPSVGRSRPDGDDRSAAADFARRCLGKLEDFDPRAHAFLEVKGNFPYKQPGSVPLKPSGNWRCNRCGACPILCPAGAIAPETPRKTDKSRCISCAACIAVCPTGARAFRGFLYRLAGRTFAKKCAARRESEVFV